MICACARVLRSIEARPALAVGRAQLRLTQQHRPALDRVERRAQLVRERREELVLHATEPFRLRPGGSLGIEQPLALVRDRLQSQFALAQRSLGPAPLVDAERYLRCADDLASGIAHRRYRELHVATSPSRVTRSVS